MGPPFPQLCGYDYQTLMTEHTFLTYARICRAPLDGTIVVPSEVCEYCIRYLVLSVLHTLNLGHPACAKRLGHVELGVCPEAEISPRKVQY